MFDVSRAHLHGVPMRRLFVELPEAEKRGVEDGATTSVCS